MKIAIYGDSFAACLLDIPHDYLGWPEIMANQPDFFITNYAVSGSSVYFSYKKFLENHMSHDINIFLISSKGRLYVKSMPEFDGRELVKHSPGLLNIINRKKQIPETLDIDTKNQVLKILDALEKYYEHLQDDEHDILVNRALVYHARSISNNTIFIHCFPGENTFSLTEIHDMENISMGVNEKYFLKNIFPYTEVDGKILVDKRVCHLTKENNEILAEKLITAIRNNDIGFNFSINDFVGPDKDDLDKYLIFQEFK